MAPVLFGFLSISVGLLEPGFSGGIGGRLWFGGWLGGGVVVVCFVKISFLIIDVINGWVLLNMGVGLVFVLGVGLRFVGFFFKVGLGVVGLFLGVGGRPPWSGPPWNFSNILISPWLTFLAESSGISVGLGRVRVVVGGWFSGWVMVWLVLLGVVGSGVGLGWLLAPGLVDTASSAVRFSFLEKPLPLPRSGTPPLESWAPVFSTSIVSTSLVSTSFLPFSTRLGTSLVFLTVFIPFSIF